MILSNGISITTYPRQGLKKGGVDALHLDLRKMERTWHDGNRVEGSINDGFDHWLPPIRKKPIAENEKMQFRLQKMKMINDGAILQYYVHEGVDTRLDTVCDSISIKVGNVKTTHVSSRWNGVRRRD